MRKLLSLVVPVLALVAFSACRDSGGDDDPTVDANTSGGDVTIQEVQNDSMVAGSKVTLKGVVVTAVDKTVGTKKGDFWVQEPDGGEYSGVQVFGGALDQVAAINVGDVVDISGAQKSEFALSTDTSGKTLTELEPVDGGVMVITKTGQTAPVVVTTVDALAIGKLSDFNARHAEWEKWEGVVVKVDNVKAFSDPECIKSMGDCTDPTYQRFDITGDVQVQSAIIELPASPKIASGDCFASVTGVVTYFFDYQILPRLTADIATGGTACVSEDTAGLCADTTDNDGNGFADCMDIGCVVASSTCRMDDTTTITEIQAGMHTDKYIKLDNVIVMAVSVNKNDIWVSTDNVAASNQGLLVHFNRDVPSTVLVGKTVTIIGKVIEFNDNPPTGTNTLTEISGYDIQVGGAATQTPDGVDGQTAATLSMDGTGEPYESVLVTLTNVKITAAANDGNFHVGSMSQAATTFKFDDQIKRITKEAVVNTCFASITGIWSYNVYDNHWLFLPTEDGTEGGTCPP